MNLFCRLGILFIGIWIQVGFVPGIHGNHLSSEDVLLLKHVQDPKCFSRTEMDFTCFFETPDNGTYDLFYSTDDKRPSDSCEMSTRTTEEGTFLHICSFPEKDVMTYVNIHVEVVESTNDTTLHSRTVTVEDNLLLDPPFDVSLHTDGQVGQLKVFWRAIIPQYYESNSLYKIRYSSGGRERIKEVKEQMYGILGSLTQGEEVEVQVSVKTALLEGGHWSSWSRPVRAVVPQSADDIALTCFTSDLHTVTCQWDGSRAGLNNEYKLFYRINRSKPAGWTGWTECVADGNSTDLCRFLGNNSRSMVVMLGSSPAVDKRSFITKEFTLSKSIKMDPPGRLKGVQANQKLYLTWDAPLPPLSAHMHYEVDYQTGGGDRWMMMKNSETEACIEIRTYGQYSIKVRAKPNGLIYSGNWSDWSNELKGYNPIDIGKLLMWCIPVFSLTTAAILVLSLYRHHRRLKEYFWPSVPDLSKVLQGFLMDINQQKWDPVIAKQCPEETASSVVEIMSEKEVSGLGKPSEEFTEFLSPEGSFTSDEQVDGSNGADVFPDYVTLRDTLNLCLEGNNYVYERVGEKLDSGIEEELLQTCPYPHTDSSVCGPDCFGSDFLNHSYLPLAELADKLNCNVTATQGPGNIYTSFPYT